jgi:biotin operon repressor
MPSADATLVATPSALQVRFRVRPSVVMELVWALLVKDDDFESGFPVRARRFAAAPGAAERIQAFWGDGETCFTEVFVVAERGGVLLEDDPERVWTGLASGAAAAPRFEALLSETPEDQVRFRGRLARLHDEPDLREAWLRLFRDTWEVVAGEWQAEGRDAAEALAWEVRTKLPEAGSYADLLPLVDGCDFGGLLPKLVGEAGAAGREVVLAPAWLGRKGFLVALTDCLLWGPPNPPRPAGPSVEVRDRARRYKALGDPTRLAIFEASARRPRTVGELARELGVAQPTVSNHVRVLRDAGLLDQEKGGGRRLVVDVAGFEQFQEESRRAVVRPAS